MLSGRDWTIEQDITQWLVRLDPEPNSPHNLQLPPEMWTAVYEELHAIAHRMMNSERVNHTLQPTALVNEAYLKLINQDKVNWQNRTHFYAVTATIMRRILLDHARSKSRIKRGGEWQPVSFSESDHLETNTYLNLITLDEALAKLAELSERMVKVVEMRVFVGMKLVDVAFALGVSRRTVDDDWSVAKKWLTRELENGEK